MKVYGNILETIGHTPLVELKNIEKKYGLKAKIIAKVEAFNPGGSVKDRVGKMLIEEGFRTGKINSETVIIEPTSGNTGIGLALTGSYYGLKVIIVMPDSMSIERINLMKAYGASIILTPGKEGMKGAINKANELAKEIPNSYIPSQFTNMANPKSHYLSTGPEIVEDLDGKVEYFVAGVGTGGTISGTGKFLKEKVPGIKIVAVEPDSSPVLSKGIAGPHKIQGIGAGFIPDTLDTSVYDEILTIGAEESYEAGRELAKEEGILVGISSGAALSAAIKIAQREENLEKTIVVLLPDRGERYLSTEMFCDK